MCKARVKEYDGCYPGAVEHSHSPNLGITEAALVRAKIKTEAQLRLFIQGSQILESALPCKSGFRCSMPITAKVHGFSLSREQTKAI